MIFGIEIQFIISQVVAILFAIAVAKHDAPAIIHFYDYLASPLFIARFHRYNFWLKFLFCVVVSLLASPYWPDGLFYGLASGLWIWLVFDPALNISSGKQKWDYLGLNDADGRFWNGLFGRNSGKIKAVLLSVAIIAVNLIYKLLL